ncbi:hypothetical protein, partial [Acinetobacter baumannii]|uniref:hypothetical protein n=1 Tax=Acinetobacter baumannii TaxID=470 RepID=UPI0033234EAF
EKNRKSDAEERKIGRRSCFCLAYSSHALLQNAAQGEESPRLISLVFRVTVRWQDLTRTSFQKEIDKAGSLPGTGGDCQ